MKNIKTIFFDLDNTLFDHSRAERATLQGLIESHPTVFANIESALFLTTYDRINTMLWKKMGDGKITSAELKVLRFELTFSELNLGPVDFIDFSSQYLEIYSSQTFAMPNVVETLNYLTPKFKLGLLSNGFARVQENKLTKLNLGAYFEPRIYSENVGVAKPHAGIFHYAAEQIKCNVRELVYVGDSYENDIVGATAAGWKAIFFNPFANATPNGLAEFEIADLRELQEIF
ncbi:MAG: YjjG family noncanonical pyrimidine nucleotidase [bacterium]